MAAKGNVRSMRLSDECLQMIESQPGESFTAKFEYLVHHCIEELPETERRLQFTKELIQGEDRRLERIRKQAFELDSSVSSLMNALQYFNRQTQAVIKRIDSLINDV